MVSLRDGIFRIGQSQKRRKAVSKRQNILEGWGIVSKVLEWRGRFRLRKKGIMFISLSERKTERISIDMGTFE